MIDTVVIQPGAETGEPAVAGVSWVLIGPLIAVRCQSTSLLPCSPSGTAVALAPSELVGVAETGRAPVGDAIAGHTVI
jgi:hypothetical protein